MDQVLSLYSSDCLFPVHPHNKKINGKLRGKTPAFDNWQTEPYTADQLRHYLDQGFNIGYRIQSHEIIIDLDPRNYSIDADLLQELVASSLGYFDFDDLLHTTRAVKTGGGGYHIYCQLPQGVNGQRLKESIDDQKWAGVEFKKAGKYVVLPPSRHPNGNYYRWINAQDKQIVLCDEILQRITRQKNIASDQKYTIGQGALSGAQLDHLILSKLDVTEYNTNDLWFPMLAGAHHATGGEGLDEFINWSVSDPAYAADEHTIRLRWESLHDKPSAITVGTLINELKNKGQDINGVKAVLDFAQIEKRQNVLADDGDQEDIEIAKQVKTVARSIDLSDIYGTPPGHNKNQINGMAIEEAKKLLKDASSEEKMIVIRLIKAANINESIDAQEILVNNKIMTQTQINKRLKSLDAEILDSFSEVLTNKTLEKIFNDGKYLIFEVSGILWAYNGVYWQPISDSYLGKLIYGVLDILKTKMELQGSEVALVTQAIKAMQYRVSTRSQRLPALGKMRPIINCKNGEVWINEDGTHYLKPHDHRSYVTNVINANYDPSAKGSLFLQTLHEIFANFDDQKEMVRHLLEILGYTIQPNKNEENWWLFKGPGGDGKSTVIKILGGILQSAQLNTTYTILKAGAGSDNHAISMLVNKLSIVVEELPSNLLLTDAGVKRLSGNTEMEANPKHKDYFKFNYMGSLFMCANSYPITRDTSQGMRRRANVIPFNREFTQNNAADRNRAQKILSDPTEMAGVLNLLLKGFHRYKQRGEFLKPQSCLIAEKEWFIDSNNVIRFVDEHINLNKQAQKPMDTAKATHLRYLQWCIDSGYRSKGMVSFYADLRNLGLRVAEGHGNKMMIYGGAWKTAPGSDDFDD